MAFISRCKSFTMVLVAIATLLLFLAGGAHSATVCRRRGGGVVDICRNATYPALCRSVVKRQKDPYAATRTTVKRLIVETKAAMKTAKRVETKYKRGELSVCLEVYDGALGGLEDSLGSLKNHDQYGLKLSLSGAMIDYETCEDAFSESKISSPLAGINWRLWEIASNALHLATLLR